MKKLTSPRWSLSEYQWSSFFKSLYKYTAPLLLVFLLQLQQGKPLNEALWLVYGAALQVAINFLSKFVTETK